MPHRLARRLPGFDTPEECLKGQIQTLECQLGRLGIELAYRGIIGPQLGEVFFLRRVGDPLSSTIMPPWRRIICW
jgi:hypothetical protein